ncbi:hypothetical protein ACOMHN_009052 [Nucella lapillus]
MESAMTPLTASVEVGSTFIVHQQSVRPLGGGRVVTPGLTARRPRGDSCTGLAARRPRGGSWSDSAEAACRNDLNQLQSQPPEPQRLLQGLLCQLQPGSRALNDTYLATFTWTCAQTCPAVQTASLSGRL